ncbi:hypothetical protein [Flavobacterium sp. N1994]|uniref:hypothetical protein n=1 Tax=Flavobacterium sp. N1994 TaxID=2986827 RepID=UPI002223BD98|nr:hypothetical protein [Flavobacterium sp. N1994]
MKKVQLQLTARQLNSLVYCFNFINQVYAKSREEKTTKSILDEVILKVKKKHLEVESSINTIFSKPKVSKFSFKYYEADALEKYVLFAEEQSLNEYDRNVVLFIKSKLNQQLA